MIVKAKNGNPIVIGLVGENEVTAVVFDRSAWVAEYGEGAFALVVRRPGEDVGLPVEITAEGGVVTWDVTAYDTQRRGGGEAQLIFSPTGRTKKTEIFRTYVSPSLTSPEDPPESWRGWIDDIIATAAVAQNAAAEAEGSAASAASSEEAAEQSAESAAASQSAAALSEAAAAASASSAAASEAAAAASEESAAQSATDAAGSQTAAASSEAAAAASEAAAEQSAADAASAAGAASSSASSAALSEAAAEQSAADAAESQRAAAGSEAAAEGSAAAAASSEADAAEAAEGAAASQSAAALSKAAAAASASSAAGSASAAAQSATAAAQSATAAASSETNAAASAAAAAQSAATLVLDPTLSSPTQAAQAKAAGDAILDTQAMIAGRETTTTATKNYSVGDLLVCGSVLYRVTAAIATGETIAEGTNVTPDTVAAELAALDADKADKVGEAPDLTAGNARQLLSNVAVEDQVPYNFRTSGGALDIGDRETDEIVGGTVAWNQLIQADASSWNRQNIDISFSGQKMTLVPTTDAGRTKSAYISITPNHKYLYTIVWSKDDSNYGGSFGIYSGVPSGSSNRIVGVSISNVDDPGDKYYNGIMDSTTSGIYFAITMGTAATTNNIVAYSRVQLFDITKMFGMTIADYVYSLEQSTPGAGVSWFRRLFPNDYYAYDPGTLRSVKTSAHRMIGFNAYDAAAGTAKLLGGNEYQITGAYTSLAYSTGETITPDADGKFTPTANGTLTVTGGGATTCVHLAYDGERDGEYAPFEAHTYALDPIELRGVPQIDGNGSLYWEGDRYKSDGTVKRNCGIVDLGTLTWERVLSTQLSDVYYFRAVLSGFAFPKNGICSKYPHTPSNKSGQSGLTENKVWNNSVSSLLVRDDDYTDAATFASAMYGVHFVYEIGTPTTEAEEPYTNPQIVDNWGTEEYIDADVASGDRDVAIPVGHVTEYPQDLRSKIEAAPNSPDADGDYIVRRENGANVYAPLIIPNELPAAPSEDGTYRLSVTVTDGTPTLSWVSDT